MDKYKYDISKSNKERDLKLANAMQRKLMIPKLGFYGFAAIGIIALIQKIYTGEVLTEKDFIFYVLYAYSHANNHYYNHYFWNLPALP